MPVAKVTELSCTSPESFEDAIRQGIDRANKTLRQIRSAWVKEQRVNIGQDGSLEFQANILGVPVIRPVVAETTALGAAYAGGLATGFWESEDDIRNNWAQDKQWDPDMEEAEREKQYRKWKKAVTKTFDWVDEDTD
jgi:flavin-binding protein dodecin